MYFLVIMVVVFGAMYFFMIRPQQRRQAQQQAQARSADEGAEVMLTSGIYGTVTGRTDDHVLITVAEGVTLKVAPAAIGRIIPEDESADDVQDDSEDDPEDDAFEDADGTDIDTTSVPGDGAGHAEES